MSAAVMSPLGTMNSSQHDEYQEEEALPMISPLFETNDDDDEPMTKEDDSIPDLSEDLDVEMDLFEAPVEEMDSALKEEMESSTKNDGFGGLVNLGNTCYLNSALQMLASLDKFQLDAPEQESELHKHFVDLLERLSRGETVNPREFKQAVDERSPLFVGYRQQDSHEFLTTLVDLLDADYKKKADVEDMEEDDSQENESENLKNDSNEDASAGAQENASLKTTEQENMEDESQENESENTKDDSVEEDEQCEEPVSAGAEDDNETDASETPKRRSFLCLFPRRPLSELQNDDISELLHGGNESSQSDGPKEESAIAPQCKLVGGRAALPMTGLSRLTSVDAVEDQTEASVPDSTQLNGDSQATSEENQEPTPIEEYFTTEVRTQLTCDSCKFTRSHVEKYLHLSLDIGAESGSVEEGLRKFFAPSQREIKCEKCFAETATQTLEISKLPRAMLLHCKRFIVDVSPDYSSITYRKNQSPFTFNEGLSLSPEGLLGEFLASDVDISTGDEEASWGLRDSDEMDDEQRSYRIRSVVNHIGSSASCGHYTCDASRLYSNGERQWTRFNDARVYKVSDDDAMGSSAQRTAYMVLYELE